MRRPISTRSILWSKATPACDIVGLAERTGTIVARPLRRQPSSGQQRHIERRVPSPIPIVSGGRARPPQVTDLSEKRATYLQCPTL